ncbi:lipopolysaccharide biosynthesis protein [Vibrio breoganii]
MSMFKKIVKGGAFRSVANLLTMGVSFLLLPVIVNSLGNELYGFWVIIASIGGYYGALDLGLSSAVIRFVSKDLDNEEKTVTYLTTSFYIFSALGILVLAIAILVSNHISLFDGLIEGSNSLNNVIIIAGISSAIGFIARTPLGHLTAHLHYDKISIIQSLVSIFRAASIYIILTSGGDIHDLAYTILFWACIETIVLLSVSINYSATNYLNFNNFSLLTVKELLSYAKYTFIAQLSDLFRNNTIPLVIASKVDVVSVTSYAIAQRVWNMVGGLCSSMLSVFTPVFSQLDGTGRARDIEQMYWKSMKCTIYIGVFLSFLVLIQLDIFLNVWLGKANGNKVYPIALALSISTICSVVQMPTLNLLYGLSKNKYYAYSNLVQGLLVIGFAWFYATELGVLGVAIATSVIGMLIKMLVQSKFAIDALKVSTYSYFRQITCYLLCPCLFGIVLLIVSRFITVQSWISIFSFSLLSLLSYMLFTYTFYLNEKEKRIIKMLIRRGENLA